MAVRLSPRARALRSARELEAVASPLRGEILRALRRRPRVLEPEREALAALTFVLAPAGRRPAQRDS